MDTLVMAAKDRQYVEQGAMVARYREAQAMTQEQLAKRVDLHTSMISKIEQGLTKPGVPNAQALDEALGTGYLIYQSYYGAFEKDETSRLRDEVAELGEKLDELARLVDRLYRRPQ